MSERNCNGLALREEVEIHEDGTQEYWRDVPGYVGFFRISDWGRVRSLPRMRKSKGGCLCPVRSKFLTPCLWSRKHVPLEG